MLSRLVSRDGVKASAKDWEKEEICPEAVESEKLEDDEDVFEEEHLKLDTKWKFIGDCAFLLPDEEAANKTFNNVEAPAQVDHRKR